MKKIIMPVFAGFILLSLLYVIRAEEMNETKELIKTKAEEGIEIVYGFTERTIAVEKAAEELEKESFQFALMEKAIAAAERDEARRKAEEEAERKRIESNHTPNYPAGGHLTRSNGVYYFGNQRETYYNLPMEGVISRARANGIGGDYWIRSDGCKMLGDYIILACNRSVHPYGSIVQTSLGLGISLDTGGFAYDYPYGVDIAVNW